MLWLVQGADVVTDTLSQRHVNRRPAGPGSAPDTRDSGFGDHTRTEKRGVRQRSSVLRILSGRFFTL